MEEKKGEFTVKDKRFKFDEGLDKENKQSGQTGEESSSETQKQEEQKKQKAAETEFSEEKILFPQINFSTFIFSLNSSALVQLGLIEDPHTGRKEKNLPLAKQTIDILVMLEEKTRGNLDTEEEQMLKNILYDLRIAYVKEKR